MVDKAEQLLLDMGFHQIRVRIHGRAARIEIESREFGKLMADETRNRIIGEFRAYGVTHITMDLMGYRIGSMNETLSFGFSIAPNYGGQWQQNAGISS